MSIRTGAEMRELARNRLIESRLTPNAISVTGLALTARNIESFSECHVALGPALQTYPPIYRGLFATMS